MAKRKAGADDTTLYADSSDSGHTGSATSEDTDDDEDDVVDYFYESLTMDTATGQSSYTASVISVAAPASPTKPGLAYPPHRTSEDQTWLYDFVDNDWTFAADEHPPESDAEGNGEEPSSSEPEDPQRLKREPYAPLKRWKGQYRWQWLNELVRGEGRGDHTGHPLCVCEHPSCRRDIAELRCKDCHGCEGFATECMVREHARNPLHRIERWNWDEGCFDAISLKELGLRFELGRENHPHRACPHPKQAPGRKFVVIDGLGIHEVDLWYCFCGRGQSFPVQLLRMKWLPSTGKRPRTAATFNVMRQYHLLSLESKCSISEFYNSLARLTNNTGERPASRYQEFINMTRIWRNLQMLKRAGRAHETDGIDQTKPGACAVECPACPHPGKNLPPDWKDASPERKFLYALFLALDANFRMQRKDVSSETKDADLGNGLAFYGEVNKYMAHLEKNWDQPQPKSTCVAHDAVNTPDKEVRGTASSGVGTVDCARHNMKRPMGVGDLQQGERYLNMDYMFFKSIEGLGVQLFFVSYDIACQWHKNIWDRMKIYPRDLCLENGGRFFVFLVPKFHLPAHIESCNVKYSFLLTRYVGQTDGEAPERGWANINRLAMSTREMSPHLRREVLDDHFNDWNWKKILAMGVFMFDRINDYIPAMVKTRRDTLEQERSLPADTLSQWKAGVVAWEENADEPNPFERTTEEISIASVRYKLATEGGGVVRGDTESADMLSQGIQLEETQRVLKFDQAAAGIHPTLTQKRVMLERCSKARRKILAWMDVQTTFMPEVAVLRAAAAAERAEASGINPVAGELVQDLRLLLPSALEVGVTCLPELQSFELQLRVGQAHEALHDLRHQLLVRTWAYQYKDTQVANNRDIMRSVSKIQGIDEQIKRATATYHVARKALEVLGPRVGQMEWASVLRVLHPDDVRQMPASSFRRPGGAKKRKESARQKKKRRTESARPISWIWLADGSAADADRNRAMNEGIVSVFDNGLLLTKGSALRIEWAKTRALGLRNTEEVDMLEEEMRRIPVFLRWRADQWEAMKDHSGTAQRPDLLDDALQREGHDAYATRQARILRTIASRFQTKWATIPPLLAQARAQVEAAEAEVRAEVSSGESSDGDEADRAAGGGTTMDNGGETDEEREESSDDDTGGDAGSDDVFI
ncbi:hypothetical protein B0H15DRAFT_953890 [Mycena belliarum]|uniref:CxC2-like cysteine cluster KDZ transposase-associated domain-containing protein n=1 Tax=Mycena belliarum TaxID=1033014 RepID=A0AAD6XM94_9AGAR|nr:hypothetical protein B0H15DRAFT_953890 [Mycena belliae]